MDNGRTLIIPVILGTARMGCMSLYAARLINRILEHAGTQMKEQQRLDPRGAYRLEVYGTFCGTPYLCLTY